MRSYGKVGGLASRPRRDVMAMLIARHKVKDFATWKQRFDGHKSAQVAAGLTNPRLFRSADDASEVVIIFDVADIAKAKAFTTSPDLKSLMTAAGVVDKPDMYFLNPAG